MITTSGQKRRPLLRADVAPSFGVLVATASVVCLSLTVFMLIAEDLFDGGGLIPHDQAVLTWFVAARTDTLVRVAKIVTAFGSFVTLGVFSALVVGFLRVRGRPWALAVAPFVALMVASLASTGAKDLFGRERPPVAVHATSVTLASFPSGHATDAGACLLAASFVLALTVTARPWVQGLYVATGFGVSTLVGLSRLVLGVHWLSDIVAAWALGLAISITVVVASWYWVTRPGRRRSTGRAQAYDNDGASKGGLIR